MLVLFQHASFSFQLEKLVKLVRKNLKYNYRAELKGFSKSGFIKKKIQFFKKWQKNRSGHWAVNL